VSGTCLPVRAGTRSAEDHAITAIASALAFALHQHHDNGGSERSSLGLLGRRNHMSEYRLGMGQFSLQMLHCVSFCGRYDTMADRAEAQPVEQ